MKKIWEIWPKISHKNYNIRTYWWKSRVLREKEKSSKKKNQHLSFAVNEIILPSWLRGGVSENSLEIFNRLCKQICISMFWSKTKKKSLWRNSRKWIVLSLAARIRLCQISFRVSYAHLHVSFTLREWWFSFVEDTNLYINVICKKNIYI